MLVTLTGGAGAGKTTLAAALAATTPQTPAQVLHGDDYYFQTPEHGVWAPDETGVLRLDVGDPRSLDLARLSHDTDTALADWPIVIIDGLFARQVTPQMACARNGPYVLGAPGLRLTIRRGGFTSRGSGSAAVHGADLVVDPDERWGRSR
ncbi:hypothetical protein ACWEWI_26135 [Streptomyces sp. NPDC003753]